MSVSLAILILYIIALFGISWFAKKRSEGNAENYALAGRRLSAPLIAVTIIGLVVFSLIRRSRIKKQHATTQL